MSRFKVIFIGVGIIPFRISGDKNFLLDLVAYLKKYNVETYIISIIDRPPIDLNFDNNFTFIPRAFHCGSKGYYFDNDKRIIGYHHQHSPLREWFELSSTLFYASSKLRQFFKFQEPAIVHWLDLSAAMGVVRLAFGKNVRYVCSALRYVPKGKLGNWLRAYMMNTADKIITGTEAAKILFVRDGCTSSQISVAPLGISELFPKSSLKRSKITRLLWSGFIQQIKEADFLKTVELSHNIRKVRSDVEFTFCLKPEFYQKKYLAFERSGIHITIGNSKFLDMLSNYDGFLSPVLNTKSTLAPPLTWIEALSCGVPILSTRVLGIEELLTDNQSALLFDDYQALEKWLITTPDLKDRLRSMRTYAVQEFLHRYHIDMVGKKYLTIYQELLNT